MTNWSPTKLGELVTITHGYAFKGEHFRDVPPGDILLTPGNFAIGGGFQLGKLKYYAGPAVAAYTLKPGDLLVTMTDLSKAGDTLGYPAIVPDDGRFYLHNQRLGKVEVRDAGISQDFVYWLMRTGTYREEILSGVTGSTVKHTSPRKIEAFEFHLPPRCEQDAICRVMNPLDDKIALNRQMNETLEATAQAIFRDWFVDFGPVRRKLAGATAPVAIMGGLTPDPARAAELAALFPARFDVRGLPVGWGDEPLADQANWVNGAAYKKMHFVSPGEGLPVVKIAELKAGVTANTAFTNTDLGSRYLIDDGELLFSWSGNPDTSIDAFIWTGGPAWLNQHIFAVRPNGSRNLGFLFAMLKYLNPTFAEIARDKQTTGLGHVTKEDLKRLRQVIPTKAVELVFDALMTPLFERIKAAQVENRTLAETRDYLLPRLMSGAVRVGNIDQVL